MRTRELCLTGIAGALCMLPVAGGCARSEGPDVVLVTLDTTRADRLGSMGAAGAHTPNLDALAARGVLFERAYASAPITLPSHTTMLTGLDPDRHGVHDNGRFTVAASLETLPERLRERGYATGAFVSAGVLDAQYGLDQGFDVYDDAVEATRDPLSRGVPTRRGSEVTDRALAWVAQRGREPLFLWTHYYDVHAPRQPPPPFDALEDPYDGELAYVDAEVGRLLEGLERARGGRPSLVVVVGDHGESLGDHGEATHGNLAYDATLHVPLIAVGPGFPAGGRSQRFARTTDVMPSILAAAGAVPAPESDGAPLQDRVDDSDAELLGYFETFMASYSAGWARIAGVRTPRWKYTAEPLPAELYDVIADPDETLDRVESEPEVAARLAAIYDGRRVRPADAVAAPLSPEVEEQLAAVGYVTAPQRFEPGREPDPRRFAATFSLIDAVSGLARRGQPADAIELLEILAETPVARALALIHLAPLYQLTGRTADAVRAWHDVTELTGSQHARLGLADSLLADGRAAEALAVADEMGDVASAPSRRVRLTRTRALLALGRSDEALRETEALLAADSSDDHAMALAIRASASRPDRADAIERLRSRVETSPHAETMERSRSALAELLRREGRAREAVQLLESSERPSADHLALMAEIAREHGNAEKAAALWTSALEQRPYALAWRRDLADACISLGRIDEALTHYDALVEAQPQDAGLRVDRGVARLRAARVAEAEADFRESTRLDDRLPEGWFNLGLTALASGRDADAERSLQRAISLRPAYDKAHFHLARLYRNRGDPRAATHAELAASGGPLGVESPHTADVEKTR